MKSIDSFQTTYEELKPRTQLTKVSTLTASRLPMRNWNWGQSRRRPESRELPDYLWGIETAFAEGKFVKLVGFQTTYEELKPLKTGLRRMQTGASRLPMRNWNVRWFFTRLLSSTTSFQTTYEELKLDLAANIFLILLASRLPMRNWNYERRSKCYGRGLASRLPMRNWNTQRSLWSPRWTCRASRLPMRNWNYSSNWESEVKENELPDYLWGIETQIHRRAQTLFFASRLPMRNWNLPFRESNPRQVPASRLPMRNWNQQISRQKWVIEWLPDYLWGIETVRPGLVKFDLYRFQTTYEELKLFRSMRLWFEYLASRLPMRNWNCQILCFIFPEEPLPDYLWGIETT